MSEQIPIGDLVSGLCDRLGVPYDDVVEIKILPTRVEVARVHRDDRGPGGEAVMITDVFNVTTVKT